MIDDNLKRHDAPPGAGHRQGDERKTCGGRRDDAAPPLADRTEARTGEADVPGVEELGRRRRELRLFGRRLRLPHHPAIRIALGVGLILGGILGFLPVLGFWMLPLGVAVLAVDLPVARRLWRAMKRAAIRAIRRYRTMKG